MKSVLLFAIAGGVGFVVDAGVLLLLVGPFGPYLGRVLSFLAAVFTTWAINRRLAFGARASGLAPHREFARYLLVCFSGGAANLATYSVAVMLFDPPRLWLPLAVAAGSLAGMTANFSLSKRFVFSPRQARRG